MSFTYEWKIPNRLIYIVISGDISAADIKESDERLHQMIESGEAPVHIMADLSQIGKVNVHPRDAIKHTSYVNHPKFGRVTIVGASALVKFFVTVVRSVAPTKFDTANDLQAGMDKLFSRDETLSA